MEVEESQRDSSDVIRERALDSCSCNFSIVSACCEITFAEVSDWIRAAFDNAVRSEILADWEDRVAVLDSSWISILDFQPVVSALMWLLSRLARCDLLVDSYLSIIVSSLESIQERR
jgi:hypothetical protein